MNQELTLIPTLTNNLSQLSQSLPTNSKTAEAITIINYAIIASVITRITIYHYIKSQEKHYG